MMPPPAVILGTPVVHAEGGTTGVSGIQRNKSNHLGTPAKHQQQDDPPLLFAMPLAPLDCPEQAGQ